MIAPRRQVRGRGKLRLKAMNRIWMVAALPFLLLALMFFGMRVPPLADTISLKMWVLALAGALLTGLCVWLVVFVGWMRGSYAFKRGDILVAAMFASLDVLIPMTLVVLIGLALRDMKNNGGLLLF